MFCKWCGGQTKPEDQVCGRCGRKIPALSDCGGFYDLAPKAPRQMETRTEPKQELNKTAQHPKRSRMLAVILCVVAVVLVVSVLLQTAILIYVSRLNGKIQGIGERIEEFYDEKDATEGTDPTSSTGPDEDGNTNPSEETGGTENSGGGENAGSEGILNTPPTEEVGETNSSVEPEETPPNGDQIEE